MRPELRPTKTLAPPLETPGARLIWRLQPESKPQRPSLVLPLLVPSKPMPPPGPTASSALRFRMSPMSPRLKSSRQLPFLHGNHSAKPQTTVPPPAIPPPAPVRALPISCAMTTAAPNKLPLIMPPLVSNADWPSGKMPQLADLPLADPQSRRARPPMEQSVSDPPPNPLPAPPTPPAQQPALSAPRAHYRLPRSVLRKPPPLPALLQPATRPARSRAYSMLKPSSRQREPTCKSPPKLPPTPSAKPASKPPPKAPPPPMPWPKASKPLLFALANWPVCPQALRFPHPSSPPAVRLSCVTPAKKPVSKPATPPPRSMPPPPPPLRAELLPSHASKLAPALAQSKPSATLLTMPRRSRARKPARRLLPALPPTLAFSRNAPMPSRLNRMPNAPSLPPTPSLISPKTPPKPPAWPELPPLAKPLPKNGAPARVTRRPSMSKLPAPPRPEARRRRVPTPSAPSATRCARISPAMPPTKK